MGVERHAGLEASRVEAAKSYLAQVVEAAQCPAVGDPVIRLAGIDPRFDGEPAMGRVRNLRLSEDGMSLLGDLTDMPTWLGDQIEADAASGVEVGESVTASFRCQIGHSHPAALVALEVNELSGIKDMDDLRRVAASHGGNMEQRDTIARAVREGRITAETARLWLEREQREVQATRPGDVMAHSQRQALRDAHDALDRGHPANYEEDEFGHLFNPNSPLGPQSHVAEPDRKQIYNKPFKRASALDRAALLDDDEEVFKALYGKGQHELKASAGYFEDDEPAQVKAARAERARETRAARGER